jgi:hypothetical protein
MDQAHGAPFVLQWAKYVILGQSGEEYLAERMATRFPHFFHFQNHVLHKM